MSTKFYKNEKFQRVFYPVLYFLLLIFLVCGACLAFSKFYYEEIYVSGPSMNPTLIGNTGPNHRSHYGKADKSRRVINNLNRFDVVITYFPDSWTTFDNDVYKIKRVWGFPGETISIKNGNTDQLVFTVTQNDKEICEYTASIKTEKVNIDGSESYWQLASFDVGRKTFKVRVDAEKRLFTKTLANDEYFIMGDNWGHSSDSYDYTVKSSSEGYITNSILQGRVVQIEGTARIENGRVVDKQKINGMFEF